jgi:hypothetical protein
MARRRGKACVPVSAPRVNRTLRAEPRSFASTDLRGRGLWAAPLPVAEAIPPRGGEGSRERYPSAGTKIAPLGRLLVYWSGKVLGGGASAKRLRDIRTAWQGGGSRQCVGLPAFTDRRPVLFQRPTRLADGLGLKEFAAPSPLPREDYTPVVGSPVLPVPIREIKPYESTLRPPWLVDNPDDRKISAKS